MREIKFRAWWDNGKESYMLFVGDDHGTTDPLDCCVYAIQRQPVILEQYTGLHDKNGKEIYEGDIVLYEDYSMGANFRQQPIRSEEIKCLSLFEGTFLPGFGVTSRSRVEKDCEVIGNIHENPELLK